MTGKQFCNDTFKVFGDDGDVLPFHIRRWHSVGYAVLTGEPWNKQAVLVSPYFDTRREALAWLEANAPVAVA